MKESIYIALLLAVITINAGVSFLHHYQVKEETSTLRSLIDFKNQGPRYTYDDGVADRVARDEADARLQEQINNLYTLCSGNLKGPSQ